MRAAATLGWHVRYRAASVDVMVSTRTNTSRSPDGALATSGITSAGDPGFRAELNPGYGRSNNFRARRSRIAPTIVARQPAGRIA